MDFFTATLNVPGFVYIGKTGIVFFLFCNSYIISFLTVVIRSHWMKYGLTMICIWSFGVYNCGIIIRSMTSKYLGRMSIIAMSHFSTSFQYITAKCKFLFLFSLRTIQTNEWITMITQNSKCSLVYVYRDFVVTFTFASAYKIQTWASHSILIISLG